MLRMRAVKNNTLTQKPGYLPEREHNAADDDREDDYDCDDNTDVQTDVSPDSCVNITKTSL